MNKIDTAWRQVHAKFIFYIDESQLKRKCNRKHQRSYARERRERNEGDRLNEKLSLNGLRFGRSIQMRLLMDE